MVLCCFYLVYVVRFCWDMVLQIPVLVEQPQCAAFINTVFCGIGLSGYVAALISVAPCTMFAWLYVYQAVWRTRNRFLLYLVYCVSDTAVISHITGVRFLSAQNCSESSIGSETANTWTHGNIICRSQYRRPCGCWRDFDACIPAWMLIDLFQWLFQSNCLCVLLVC